MKQDEATQHTLGPEALWALADSTNLLNELLLYVSQDHAEQIGEQAGRNETVLARMSRWPHPKRGDNEAPDPLDVLRRLVGGDDSAAAWDAARDAIANASDDRSWLTAFPALTHKP